MHWLILSGTSGSGKSVALGALEDVGFHCVNNLPASLLPQFSQFLKATEHERVAVSVDTRTAGELHLLPSMLKALRHQDRDVQCIFLDAKVETLVKRFSETRRRHPMDDGHRTLRECIIEEKSLLSDIRALGYQLDTSELRATALRAWIKDLVRTTKNHEMVLQLQSFGFKHGSPQDADFVFDVRCLPNPFYEPTLAPLTGQDLPVQEFLEQEPAACAMLKDIQTFIQDWLPAFERDQRRYVTVAIGCTGGQHRSVFITERLATYFIAQGHSVLLRHRELYSKSHGQH
jgi:RNase adapter protein RapZ